MKRGKIVSRVRTNNTTLGAVLETELRDCGWRFLKVQWIRVDDDILPSTDNSEWIRHDHLVFVEPFEQMKNIQDAMTLSSALLSENYKKILEKTYEKRN